MSRTKILFIIIISLGLCLKAEAALVIESQHLKVYVPTKLEEQLNEEQKSFLILKYQDLLDRLILDSSPHIPNDIEEILLKKKIVLTMVEGLSPYGMFIPQVTKEWDRQNKNLFEGNADYFKEDVLHIFFNPFEEIDEQFRIIAHEYFHAIHFILNPNEEDWVKEGLAQVFEMKVTGLPFRKHLEHGLSNLTAPLISEYNHEEYQSHLYGHHFLYFYYLYKYCGGLEIVWNIARSNSPPSIVFEKPSFIPTALDFKKFYGIENIDLQLKTASASQNLQCHNFIDSIKSFEIARVLNRDVWGLPHEKQYFIYPYHPSPIINLYTLGIEKVMPAFVPFVVNDADKLRFFPSDEIKNFAFFKVRMNIPRAVTEIDNPSNLLDNFRPEHGEKIILFRITP